MNLLDKDWCHVSFSSFNKDSENVNFHIDAVPEGTVGDGSALTLTTVPDEKGAKAIKEQLLSSPSFSMVVFSHDSIWQYDKSMVQSVSIDGDAITLQIQSEEQRQRF